MGQTVIFTKKKVETKKTPNHLKHPENMGSNFLIVPPSFLGKDLVPLLGTITLNYNSRVSLQFEQLEL
jgi:hypothetical protein